jgi:hypothetical protein
MILVRFSRDPPATSLFREPTAPLSAQTLPDDPEEEPAEETEPGTEAEGVNSV